MESLTRQLESPANCAAIIRLICNNYNMDPSIRSNITSIRAFLGPLRVEKIATQAADLESANELISTMYGKSLAAARSSIPDNMDATKEYLLRVINAPGDDAANGDISYKDTFKGRIEGFDGLGSLLTAPMQERIEVVKYLNYSSLFRDEYIVIDSRYQNTVNTDPTKMIFSLINHTKTKSDNGGVVIGSSIQNIVEIEAYPFTIPYKPEYVTFYNKITLGIQEWLTSCFEAYEGGEYHFCFDIDKIENNLIYLKPVNSVFSFAKPVRHVDACTLSFGAVYSKIAFDPDRMSPSVIDYTNTRGLLTFTEPHGCITGDLVYVSGFATPDPARDALLIAEVNRAEGHTITRRNIYSFIINVDLTTARHESPAGSGLYPIMDFAQDVTVFFASKRVQIQLRMRYLTSYSS